MKKYLWLLPFVFAILMCPVSLVCWVRGILDYPEDMVPHNVFSVAALLFMAMGALSLLFAVMISDRVVSVSEPQQKR